MLLCCSVALLLYNEEFEEFQIREHRSLRMEHDPRTQYVIMVLDLYPRIQHATEPTRPSFSSPATLFNTSTEESVTPHGPSILS